MVYIDIKTLVNGLTQESDGGTNLSFEEYLDATPLQRETIKTMKTGSVNDAPPPEREALANFFAAINTVEPDDSRISLEEFKDLNNTYFEQNFFEAVAIEANRRGVEDIFSASVVERFSEVTKAVIKKNEKNLEWFDAYLKLRECGIDATFEDAYLMVRSPAWRYNNGYSENGRFWDFLKNYLVPIYMRKTATPGLDLTKTDQFRSITIDGTKEDFFDGGITALYNIYEEEMTNGGFIDFIQNIENCYQGISAIKDIAYFIRLYKDEGRKENVLRSVSWAKKFSSFIPISGSLDMKDLEKIVYASENTDPDRLGSFIGYFRGNLGAYNLPKTVDTAHVPLLLDIYDTRGLRRMALSEKAAYYIPRFAPKNWSEIYYALKTMEHLPDDIGLLIRTESYLMQYGAKIKFGLKKDDYEKIPHSRSENGENLEMISSSPLISEFLKLHNEKYPERKIYLSLDDIARIAEIDEEAGIDDIKKWVEYEDLLVDCINGPHLGNWGNELSLVFSYMAENPDERNAALSLIAEFPKLLTNIGLGVSGIMNSEEMLDRMREDKRYYDLLTKNFGINGINWTATRSERSRLSIMFDKIVEPDFSQGAERVFKICDRTATPAQGAYLHSEESIIALLLIYKHFPAEFKKIVEADEDIIRFYMLLMGDRVPVGLYADFDEIDRRYPISNAWDIMLLMVKNNLLETFSRFVDIYDVPKTLNCMYKIVAAAVWVPEGLRRMTEPDIVMWYKDYKSREMPDLPLPEIDFNSSDDVRAAVQALPAIYEKREILDTMAGLCRRNFWGHKAAGTIANPISRVVPGFLYDSYKHHMARAGTEMKPSWDQLAELFKSDLLVSAVSTPGFEDIYPELFGGKEFSFKNILVAAKIVAMGVELDTVRIVKRSIGLGKDAPELLVMIKGKEELIESEPFVRFYRKISSDYFGGRKSVIDLAASVRLYEHLVKSGDSYSVLETRKFTEYLEFVKTVLGVPLNGNILLNTYLLMKMDQPLGKLRKMMELLDRPIEANDLLMLAAVSTNRKWADLFEDREGLEETLGEKLEALPAKFRSRWGSQIASKDYTERPPLKDLDLLFLMRAYVMLEAIEKGTMLSDAASLIKEDIDDKRTEYMVGVNVDPETGLVRLEKIESLSFSDGSGISTDYGFFQSHLFTGHLHAVAGFDESDYAGPSGDIEFPASQLAPSDFGAAYNSRQHGMVITPCGFDDEGNLLINFDLYYVSERERRYGEPFEKWGDSRFEGHVLDLGLYSLH